MGPGDDGAGADGYLCCVCADPIGHVDFIETVVWADPDGTACCAHRVCLIRVGETELALR